MPQPAPTAAERGTSILLATFMDHLSLADIVRGMAVSRFWREQAINHRTYYGDLRMTDSDPLEYAEFILLRLSRSAGRPVSIFLELGDQNPAGLLEAIASHIGHITSLTVHRSTDRSLAPFLASLCDPAPILRKLKLGYKPKTYMTTPPTTPIATDFLAGYAPALEDLSLTNFSLPPDFPPCFWNIKSLSFGSVGHVPDPPHGRALTLPNPFARCTHLRILRLKNNVTLDPAACVARQAWERVVSLVFSGGTITDTWPTLGLPLGTVKLVGVNHGNAESAAALIDTLPGALEVTLHPPHHTPGPVFLGGNFELHHAAIRSTSNPHITRSLSGRMSSEDFAVVFEMPTVTNRVVRLVLPLTGWYNFVSFNAFGPFDVLEELIVTLNPESDFRSPPSSKLSCPRLKRLVLSSPPWAREQPSVEIGRVATFALAALAGATFPLKLEFAYVTVSGSCDECAEAFTSCSSVDHELTHNTLYDQTDL